MAVKRFFLDGLVLFVVLLVAITSDVGRYCSTFSKRYRASSNSEEIRLAASEDLPIIDLIESPNRMYDPKPTDIDEHVLRERLGDAFDPRFMSVTDPALRQNATSTMTITSSATTHYVRNKKGILVPKIGKIPKFVRKFVRKFVQIPPLEQTSSATGANSYVNSFKSNLHSPTVDGRRAKGSQRLRRKLRHFLWAYVFCPVRHSWKDLGLRFWPRWLREGHCVNIRSCSFPEGMSCKQKKSIGKTILRWHCQDWDRSRYCKWIPVRYPVVTACACSC